MKGLEFIKKPCKELKFYHEILFSDHEVSILWKDHLIKSSSEKVETFWWFIIFIIRFMCFLKYLTNFSKDLGFYKRFVEILWNRKNFSISITFDSLKEMVKIVSNDILKRFCRESSEWTEVEFGTFIKWKFFQSDGELFKKFIPRTNETLFWWKRFSSVHQSFESLNSTSVHIFSDPFKFCDDQIVEMKWTSFEKIIWEIFRTLDHEFIKISLFLNSLMIKIFDDQNTRNSLV